MKRLIILMLVLVLLCGCGQTKPEETEETTVPTTEATEPPTTEPPTEPPTTEPPTEPPTEPGPINPLNGESVPEEITDRPYAIMINNHKAALPHCGITAADVLYETLVEGGMTRFLAIFSDPELAGPIGSVRSARPPHAEIAQGYDAVYSSARGHPDVVDVFLADGLDWIDGLAYDGTYFYRDKARRAAGVSLEHTMFVEGADLEVIAEKKGIRTEKKEQSDYGFHFDEEAEFSGETANEILISFQPSKAKTTNVYYDETLGAYTLYQQGKDYIDGNTGKKVEFRNVFILYAESYGMSNGIHVYVETVGEGDGYYARDGKLIPIHWSRESKTSPYVYTTEDGAPVNMGVGKTYIAIIKDESPVTWE